LLLHGQAKNLDDKVKTESPDLSPTLSEVWSMELRISFLSCSDFTSFFLLRASSLTTVLGEENGKKTVGHQAG
jgi:hypothetical protein